jgi:hypothetical protein
MKPVYNKNRTLGMFLDYNYLALLCQVPKNIQNVVSLKGILMSIIKQCLLPFRVLLAAFSE